MTSETSVADRTTYLLTRAAAEWASGNVTAAATYAAQAGKRALVSVAGGDGQGRPPAVEVRTVDGAERLTHAHPLAGEGAALAAAFASGRCPRGVLADWFDENAADLTGIPDEWRALLGAMLRGQGMRPN